jgi:hypothetical protein
LIGGLGTALGNVFKIISSISLKHMFMSSILGQLFWVKAYKQKDLDEEVGCTVSPKVMPKQQHADAHAL